ncbi:MAG TPA: tetratricopeptide repeat protein [Anaerolineae bacterium]|nr:tetratricopeptide repeat protein [Anaerolineae bacterium]
MRTKLSKYADGVMESGWLLALILAPLFFNVYSQRVFEPDKISLVRTVALFALAAAVVKWFETWRTHDQEATGEASARGWRQPLVLPVLALAFVYLLATLLSVTPTQSFWGSYQRLQGALSMFSYIILFFVTLNALRREEQWRRLQYTIILVSLPIALYGIIQHYRLDPLPWGGDTVKRVAGNMGNSIFLAAYLIMAVPLTIERLITATRKMLLDEEGSSADALVAGALFFVLVIQLIAILFTQSRGPWIGLAAGLYVFGLLALTSLRQQAGGAQQLGGREIVWGIGMGLLGIGVVGAGLFAWGQIAGWLGGVVLLVALMAAIAFYLVPLFRRRGWRWLWLSFITQSAIAALVIVLLNLSPAFLPGFRDIPYVGRLAQLMDFEKGTGRVRVLIWQGVVDMMLRPHEPLTFPDGRVDVLNPIRPLIGYGPESMWVAYNRFYRPELGELERRNASPDRSHNETFDSLVNTGILGFLAYFALFFGIFFHALTWLGLIPDRFSRYLFFILGISGAAIGVIIPWVLGVPEFLGVGLPLGFMVGVLLYITYAAFRGSAEIATLERRHLLIIAIFATIVAHFMEVHFGIAIVSTRTYFFILTAALVVLGTEKLAFQPPLVDVAPAGASSRRGRGKGKPRRDRRSTPARPDWMRPQAYWRMLLPFAMILAIILLVLDWNFITGQIESASALTIFVKSWLVHLSRGRLVDGPGVATLLLFSVVVAAVLAVGETWHPRVTASELLKGLGVFLAMALGVWLVAGLIFAAQLTKPATPLPVMQQASRIANTIVWFYALMLLAGAGLAVTLVGNDRRPATRWAARPWLAGVGAVAMLGLAFYMMVSVNINLVRADIYFKIAQGADGRGDWPTAQTFYEQALKLTPNEDYYMLFLGRALLERARASRDQAQRDAFFKRAEEVLKQAQAVNPLNTDHTANLARFYGTMAGYLSDPAERRLALLQAVENYLIATQLSPNVAHLRNELGSVYAQLGEYEKARAQFQRSLELDPGYVDTYLRLAQLELDQENWEAAYEAYRQAAEVQPKDPRAYSGMAFALAKMGRIEEAIAMNKKVLELRPNDLSALQNLALLYDQLGEYELALRYARMALKVAPESQKPAIEALIQSIERKMSP